METIVEYFCVENKHPLENTYWKTKVRISVWDEDKGCDDPRWNGPTVPAQSAAGYTSTSA